VRDALREAARSEIDYLARASRLLAAWAGAPVAETPAPVSNDSMALHKHHGAERVVEGRLPRAHAAMNITPMIDVLLVLLVIFMVTLPLNQRGLDVNLPAETQQPKQATPDISQIVVNYTADKKISINNKDVSLSDLESTLRTIFEERTQKTMFIMGAGSLRYGEIVEVIDAAKGAGVEKVGIVTEGMRRGSSGGE
jgi:biopolymer transport protein ExbD